MQNVITTIQAEYHDKPVMVPQATSLVNFTQLVGGIVGIAVSGSVFGNRLSSGIALYAPELDSAIAIAVKQSVKVIATLEGAEKAAVIKAYSEALGGLFFFGSIGDLVLTSFSLVRLRLHHWHSRGHPRLSGCSFRQESQPEGDEH